MKPSDDLLLWIAIKGLVPRDHAERRLGAEHAPALDELVAEGLLADDSGYLSLTDHGDQMLSSALQERLPAEERSEVEDFFTTFELLDQELKSAATDWQVQRAGDDADALMAAIERWYSVDDRLADAVRTKPAVIRTVRGMDDALHAARQRFAGGDRSAFTGIDDDTYHSIWFVLHELLLRTLGRQRVE